MAWDPLLLLSGYTPLGSLSTPHQQVPAHSPHWLCDLGPVAPPLCACQSPYPGGGKPRPCTRKGLWNHAGLALAPHTPPSCHPTFWATLSSHSHLVWGPGPKQEGWDELSGKRPAGQKAGVEGGAHSSSGNQVKQPQLTWPGNGVQDKGRGGDNGERAQSGSSVPDTVSPVGPEGGRASRKPRGVRGRWGGGTGKRTGLLSACACARARVRVCVCVSCKSPSICFCVRCLCEEPCVHVLRLRMPVCVVVSEAVCTCLLPFVGLYEFVCTCP